MKPEPTPLRIESPCGMGIWKRRKNSWIWSPGSPGIWGSCIWVRTGAVVVLMLTTAGPFCSTRALKSGSALAADVWICGVWACELDRVSLPGRQADVRAVPEQQLVDLRVAARGGRREGCIAVLGGGVGVGVLGEELPRVSEVALLDGVEQPLDALGALLLRLFFQARWK